MPLTAAQKALNSQQHASITYQGKEVKIYGKSATLQYLGLIPVAGGGDIAGQGESQTVQRKGFQRARWFGDSGGPSIPATSVERMLYPSKTGNATPGRPFRFQAVTDTGGDNKGRKVSGSLNIVGPWGAFVAYLTQNRPPHSVNLWNPSGSKLKGPVLSDTDFDAQN